MPARRWLTGIIICDICGHQQVSVWPIEAERLECGNCGHMNVAPPPCDDDGDCDEDEDDEADGASGTFSHS